MINAGQGLNNTSWQAHHLIPNQTWTANESFFNAIGFTGRHDASNGIALPSTQAGGLQTGHSYYHSSSHGNYTGQINVRVARIENRYNTRIAAGMSAYDAAALAKSELIDLQKAAHRMLNRKNGGISCSRVS
jgi:hypothetical protein